MTPTDLANRALGYHATPRPQIDPITLAILLAILSTVVEHLTERCLERLDHETIKSPGMFHKAQLWGLCLSAAHRHKGTHKHGTEAFNALLKWGQAMDETELHGIKMAYGHAG